MADVSRLAAAFGGNRTGGHPALVTFVTAGDGPTAAILDALVEGGADVIELGMPFTDPMADGPAIQAANLRSLGAGTKTADIFRIAGTFRARHPDTPLVLMGYANPMTTRGPEWFAEQCQKSGVDGVICVDIPPEEDPELGPALRAAGVSLIRLATPTSDEARLKTILKDTSGFVYYVSVAGITGKQQAVLGSIEDAVTRLKAATTLPVAVGLRRAHARAGLGHRQGGGRRGGRLGAGRTGRATWDERRRSGARGDPGAGRGGAFGEDGVTADKYLPGTGRGTARRSRVVVGSELPFESCVRWRGLDPSVSAARCHLPVPGRY